MSENVKRYYALYDKVAKLYDNAFPCVNDLVAVRLGKEQCAKIYANDKHLANDLEVHYLYSLDISTGKITENAPSLVFSFHDFIETDLKEQK